MHEIFSGDMKMNSIYFLFQKIASYIQLMLDSFIFYLQNYEDVQCAACRNPCDEKNEKVLK